MALTAAGCTARPPAHADATGVTPSPGPFAALARCTPAPGTPPPACPGDSCATNAEGPPDGQTVDLERCPTLDLAFIGGTLVAQTGKSDLGIRLGLVGGLTRVEASREGMHYTLVAFIAADAGALPAGTADTCAAEISENIATVSFTRCETITEVGFVRLTRDSTVPGAATVDAMEALSLVPSS